MEKEDFDIQCLEYLRGELSSFQKEKFEDFMASNPDYYTEFLQIKGLFIDLDFISTEKWNNISDSRFYDWMKSLDEDRKNKSSLILNTWSSPRVVIQVFKLAATVLIFFLGFFVGKNQGGEFLSVPTENYAHENRLMKEKLILAMIDHPEVNMRLKAMNYAKDEELNNQKVVDALLTTLNYDHNVNVRLAALHSLEGFIEIPEVRLGVLRTLENQESPLVVVTIANLMVKIQERAAIKPLKQVLSRENFNNSAKNQIKENIKLLAYDHSSSK